MDEHKTLERVEPPSLSGLAGAIAAGARAEAIFAAPIVNGEVTVIPVARARYGVGGGRGRSGGGSGGGMRLEPIGFIVVDRQGARFRRTSPAWAQPLTLGLGVLLGVAAARRLMRRRRRAL